MRKILTFPDGKTVEVSPISYEEFVTLKFWFTDGKADYKKFLLHNNFLDPNNYSEEMAKSMSFSLILGEPEIEFQLYEDEGWIECTQVKKITDMTSYIKYYG